jgi:hypothetical protein
MARERFRWPEPTRASTLSPRPPLSSTSSRQTKYLAATLGREFNDFYRIIIRSDKNDITSESQSMNQMGLGAFGPSGSTDWLTLQMAVDPATSWVQFDVGVQNVADAQYQSQIMSAPSVTSSARSAAAVRLVPVIPSARIPARSRREARATSTRAAPKLLSSADRRGTRSCTAQSAARLSPTGSVPSRPRARPGCGM